MDFSTGRLGLGMSILDINPKISMSDGNGNKSFLTLPVNPLGILMNGITVGSSHTNTNGMITQLEYNYKPGNGTIALAAVAAVCFVQPEAAPFIVPILNRAAQ